MASELQRVVDALAARLNRPILVEDHHQRVIAYSEHEDPGDDVRREAILRRRSPAAAISWWERFGISSARGPVRTPGNPRLHLSSRVCVPIRHGDTLLGHVWLVDADGSITDEEIGRVTEVAGELALALYAEKVAGELQSRREAEAVRDLLLGDAGVRAHAADVLIRDGHFEPDGHVTGVVVLPHEAPGDELTLTLETGLAAARRRLGPRAALHLVRRDHALLLAAAPGGSPRRAIGACVAALEDGLGTTLGAPIIGVGDGRAALKDAGDSYAEALHAAQVAAQGEAAGVGRVAHWADLGIYRLLARVSSDELASSVVHPGLERLLAQPRSQPLVETLEAYLECAGSVQATAERLRLHRQSLYYRLERIERLAATNLHDGNERLSLHLALKLARLNGRLTAMS